MKKFIFALAVLGLVIGVQAQAADPLGKKLSGHILLQVEAKGEAWYINPGDFERYYLGRAADAFNVMKQLGLGISAKDFSAFEKGSVPKQLAGKILLNVGDSGKAYYVHPKTLKLHYLGKPEDAYQLMRQLGLGVTNKDLSSVTVSKRSADPSKTPPIVTVDPLPFILEQARGVVVVVCVDEDGDFFSRGSGSIGHSPELGYIVVTNDHVITTNDCAIASEDLQKGYRLDPTKQFEANEWSDATIIGIAEPDIDLERLVESVPEIDLCAAALPISTPIYAIGYPISGGGNRLITIGALSGLKFKTNIPYPEYYVTTKIEPGSSGGIAFGWTDNKLCVLGLPTWLEIKKDQSTGIVQSIWNIFQHGSH